MLERDSASFLPGRLFLFFKWRTLPLDRCLVSEDIRVADVKTGEAIGSDHLPLIVELEL